MGRLLISLPEGRASFGTTLSRCAVKFAFRPMGKADLTALSTNVGHPTIRFVKRRCICFILELVDFADGVYAKEDPTRIPSEK